VRQIRGRKENDPRFGSRMNGEGNFAELIRQRFHIATRKFGLTGARETILDTSHFIPPRKPSPQAELF
jgi:hypothetical protein